MKVLFLTQTPEIGASPRFRVYQYLEYLRSKGIQCDVHPGVPASYFQNLIMNRSILDRLKYYTSPLWNRISELPTLRDYDVIFLQRDISIYLPPLLEKLIVSINKNFVFDFDDAIYMNIPHDTKFDMLFRLRGKNKVAKIIMWSKHIITGNRFLAKYASKYNPNVTIIPTCIDTDKYKVKGYASQEEYKKIVIGWVGRPGSLYHLKTVLCSIRNLSKRYEIELKLVGASLSKEEASGINVTSKGWNLQDELELIHSFDIGVNPLVNDAWSHGKCAAKLIQYMAAGIPAVASPIGVNCEIITHGENGFLANDLKEWEAILSYLIENKKIRREVGLMGRRTAEEKYSLKTTAPILEGVLRKVAEH